MKIDGIPYRAMCAREDGWPAAICDDDVPFYVAEPSTITRDSSPARLVTGLITERGVAEASRSGLAALFPERAGRS